MAEFSYEQIVKATENFSIKRLLGKGSHGLVYKGTLEDNKLVAVKKQSQGLQCFHDNSKLDNEINTLSSLRENQHIIKLIGTSHDLLNNKLLVMELLSNGPLHDLLHVCDTPPTWPKRVETAMQIAQALQFLHERKPLVIHRDIKSSNILFDLNWNAKLVDFGLAILGVNSPISRMSRPAGTIGYLDPRYTTTDKLSTKIDIFSFGVVLLEIVSCRKVIDVCKSPASIVDWAIPLIKEKRFEQIIDPRTDLPLHMVGRIRRILHIAARCVSANEGARPSIGQVIVEMESCSIERVRFPIWITVLRSVVLLRKRRKLKSTSVVSGKSCATHEGDVYAQISNEKMLLREMCMFSQSINTPLHSVSQRT